MFELIPLKPESLLSCRKAKLGTLHLLLNIVNEALEACKDFLNKKYTNFDAQVGETACQIRAYKICLLASNSQFISKLPILALQIIEYRNYLTRYIKEFEDNMLAQAKYSKELDKKETKEDFLNKLQFDLSLNDDCLFIILSHFLNKYCIFDEEAIPNAINYALIKKILNIGSTPARHLANHYQSILSRLSCEFILEQPVKTETINKKLLNQMVKIGDRRRFALPYYDATKVLLFSINTVSLPMILSPYYSKQSHGNHQIFFFKKDCLTNKMMLQSELNNTDLHIPAIIFRGYMQIPEHQSFHEFKNNILQIDFQKIILLNAASHPQYTGETLNNYIIDPYKDINSDNEELEKILAINKDELIQARILAETIGCSKINFSLFYIKHIFCSTFYDERNALFYGDPLCLTHRNPQTPNNIRMNF
ncbi:MAG: hypothetical protein K0R14_1599 [Burkholderiales bacterium]|jgi:hypothetical protein|nr:hypothetical protein [Burkholderiales bacterium]